MRPSDPGAPRLVYDADAPTPPTDAHQAPRSTPVPTRPSRARALRLLFAALLIAAAVAAVEEWRRAAALEARVVELSAKLADAQREIAARRAQIDTIRGSLADVRERIVALEAVAGADPAPRAATPPPPAPAH